MKSVTDMQNAVSAHIKDFKRNNKMTFRDMGEITGIHHDTIRGYAYCRFLPGLYSAYLLADAMGMTVNELMGGAK